MTRHVIASAMSLPSNSPLLSDILLVSAQHVRTVIDGHSLSGRLDDTPAPLRSAVQAISFYTMRRLGFVRAIHATLVQHPTPQPLADALLLVALALLDAATQAQHFSERPCSYPIYATHTIVDQAVRAATGHRNLKRYKGLVNAVLRAYLRNHAALRASLAHDLQARWNFPIWWIQQVQIDHPEHWQSLLATADTPGPLTLRVNRRRQTVTELLACFDAHDIAAQRVADAGILLPNTHAVHTLPGFAQGWWSVQDAAAQLAAPLLAPCDGMRVLDACAAPGGKTAHLLELADIRVQALDLDPQRLQRVQQNLQWLGLAGEHVTLTAADAAKPHTWWDGKPFDAILADVPCTASGVVRRHPDIRWLRRKEDLARTASLQRRIVDALWPTLRPGGHLLYATCSVFAAEGEMQAQAMLQRWPDAQRRPAPGQLLPLAQDASQPAADGFFYALFRKQG